MRRGGIVGIRRRQAHVDGSGPHGIVDQHQALVDAIGRNLDALGHLDVCRRKTHVGALVTSAGNNTSQHVRAAEQLGGKLNMTLAQLLANTGGADRLPIDAQQLVAIDVNAALGSPCLHLGNARGAAATQPKVATHAN